MLSWLSFIPIVGKVFDSVTAYFTKKQDVDLEKYKVNGQVNVAAMQAEVQLVQAQKDLRQTYRNSPGVTAAMLLFMIPSGVWYASYMWDSTFRDLIPDYTWRVLTPEAEVWKILGVIVGFLFLSTVSGWRK